MYKEKYGKFDLKKYGYGGKLLEIPEGFHYGEWEKIDNQHYALYVWGKIPLSEVPEKRILFRTVHCILFSNRLNKPFREIIFSHSQDELDLIAVELLLGGNDE